MRTTYEDGEDTAVDMCRSAVAQGRALELGRMLHLGVPEGMVHRCACGVKGSRWGDRELAERVFAQLCALSVMEPDGGYATIMREFLR